MKSTFDEPTLSALKASIHHWGHNAKAPNPYALGIGIHSGLCALCAEFLDQADPCCGCPVRERTEVSSCDYPIWRKARTTFHAWQDSCASSPAIDHEVFLKAKENFHQAAQAQLEFLTSLLPKENLDD